MSKNTWVYFFIILLLASCKDKSNVILNSNYANERTFNIKEFVLLTEEQTFLRDYNIVSSSFSESSDIIIGYNYQIHSLDLFDMQNNCQSQIQLNAEGEDAILSDIQGLCFHKLDSIWIYNEGVIYLVDTASVVKERINIRDFQDEEVIIFTNYSISKGCLYYNNSRKSLFYPTREIMNSGIPQFYVNEYFLEKQEVKKYELSSSHYDADIMSMYGWKNAPNVTFAENQILYNYPIEANIYTINLDDDSKHTYGGKSKYTKNTVARLSSNTNITDAERHKIENVHFYEIIYNSNLNLYFRFHVDKNDFFPNEDGFIQFNKKDLYLMVFNEEFEIVNESKLVQNRYSIINSWCPVSKGLLIFANNFFLDAEVSEDALIFDVLEL